MAGGIIRTSWPYHNVRHSSPFIPAARERADMSSAGELVAIFVLIKADGMKVSIKLRELRTSLVPFHSDLAQRNVEFFSASLLKPVAFADFNGLLASTRLISVLLTQQ